LPRSWALGCFVFIAILKYRVDSRQSCWHKYPTICGPHNYVANRNSARAYLHIRDVPFRVALDVKTGLATFSWH
jgi:hypothetical protein